MRLEPAFTLITLGYALKIKKAHAQSRGASEKVSTQGVGDTDGVVSPISSGEVHDLDAVGSAKASAGSTQTDIGVLQRQKLQDGNLLVGTSRALDDSGECPPEFGVVTCKYGVDVENGDSCQSACDGHCCVDTDSDSEFDDPCYEFTGTICKDGNSCNGNEACRMAHIDKIIGGCNGNRACTYADVEEIVDSCLGEKACKSFRGETDRIVRSCSGYRACNYADVKEIVESCLGDKACYNFGDDTGYRTGEGEIVNSCLGDKACENVEWIGTITRSCSDEKACRNAGIDAGQLFDLVDCCNMNGGCEGIIAAPSTCGTNNPTSAPTLKPTTNPTTNPSPDPTPNPTPNPTTNPTSNPSPDPSTNPTSNPTKLKATKSKASKKLMN